MMTTCTIFSYKAAGYINSAHKLPKKKPRFRGFFIPSNGQRKPLTPNIRQTDIRQTDIERRTDGWMDIFFKDIRINVF
jgi:hypothetical protein